VEDRIVCPYPAPLLEELDELELELDEDELEEVAELCTSNS
jgi:hypothetical protein